MLPGVTAFPCHHLCAEWWRMSGKNLQAKSLKSFVEKYNTKINVRTSMANFRVEEWLTNIPLYSIGNIEKIIK